MTERKEQKIIVLLSLTPADKTKILVGIKIASLFRKELSLAYNYSSKEKGQTEVLKEKLTQYTLPIKNNIPGLKVSTLLFSLHVDEIPETLADNYEAIFIIIDKKEFSKYKSMLSESSVPLLFINSEVGKISDFKQLILPLDLRPENSDTALWASYFGRFNQSGIVLLAANDKHSEAKKQVAKNVVLTQKLFQKFNIQHKIFKGEKTSFGNSFEALELAKKSKADLLLILGSSNITPLDYLLGLPEKKIIKSRAQIPILFLNPKKDNYILCD